MNTNTFTTYLTKLQNTPKRLEITTILSQLISELEPQETEIGVNLSLGFLKAPFASLKFNMADKMIIRAIEAAYSTPKTILNSAEISKVFGDVGDLGNVVEKYSQDSQSEIKKSNPTLTELYKKLTEIAEQEGSGSQESKTTKTAALLRSLTPQSAKFVTRIILGTTRLGFTELTVVAALAEFLGDKKLAEKIEAKYNCYPDIGLIARVLKEKGISGLNYLKITPGVPVLSQKAQRVSGMEEAFERTPKVWAEFKFDGTRVQLHLDKSQKNADVTTDLFGTATQNYLIKTYTRNLEETTHQYPDITEAADKFIKANSIILDGEAIGYNPKTGEFLPFQETIQRKRKYNVAETAKNIPLKYFVFDILFLNGKSTIDLPLTERHKLIEQVVAGNDTIIPAEFIETDRYERLQELFEESKERKLEGLIVKTPSDPYQAGARSYSWIKLKKADEKLLADSIDCVVLGYYFGKGVRSKFGVGGFLVGIYDKSTDTFKTLSKIGTGLTDEDWGTLKTLADKYKVAKIPANVEVNSLFTPDVICKPGLVVEIGADELSISPSHSAGFALRFPRLIKFRTDKAAIETTGLDEVREMFGRQRRK